MDIHRLMGENNWVRKRGYFMVAWWLTPWKPHFQTRIWNRLLGNWLLIICFATVWYSIPRNRLCIIHWSIMQLHITWIVHYNYLYTPLPNWLSTCIVILSFPSSHQGYSHVSQVKSVWVWSVENKSSGLEKVTSIVTYIWRDTEW